MHLRHLSLTNFRLYSRLEVDLPSQAILLYGDNAQGKTSLLEAIYVLATGRSSHTTSDRQLINWLASEEGLTPHARLAADVVRADRALHIDMVLMLEPAKTEDGWRFRKQIKVNGAVVRATDLIGQIAVVMFLPDDVEIVGGGPANRRKYLDNALSQVDVEYARALDLYTEVSVTAQCFVEAVGRNRRHARLRADLSTGMNNSLRRARRSRCAARA